MMKLFDVIKNKLIEIFKKDKEFSIDEHDIKGEAYKIFIRYALEYSDTFTFCIPNFNYLRVTDTNKAFLDKEDIADSKSRTNIKDNEDFKIYKRNVQPFLNVIENQIIATYNNTVYNGQIYNYDSEIYVAEIKDIDKCFEFLTSADSLFSWKANKYPEDICFFANGYCWLQSIAHEGDCFVYINDSQTLQKLKDMGLKFTVKQKKIKLK